MLAREYHEMIKKFRSIGEYHKALQVAHEALMENRENEMLKNDYGWCLYHIYLKKQPVNQEEVKNFKKALAYIIKNIKPQNKYSPLKLSLTKAIEYRSVIGVDEKTCLGYYEALGQEELSVEEKQMEIEGKLIELPTEKEKWYMKYSKALYQAQQYEKALSLCEEALQGNLNFHNKNKEWLTKRKADCFIGIGDTDLGIKLIEEVKKQLVHWSLDASLANAYLLQNKQEQAGKYFARAAQQGGVEKGKVKLYKQYVKYLKETNLEMACTHLQLIKNIYEEEKWSLKDSMLQEIEDMVKVIDIEDMDTKVLEKVLKNFWDQQVFVDQEVLVGHIKSILPNGKAGFIEASNGQRYYFSIKDFRGPRRLVEEGKKVIFYVEIGYDRVKQRESLNAVGIKLAERGA